MQYLKEQGELWRNIKDKEEHFYVPLLKAFVRELERLNQHHQGVIPERMLNYLLGRNDFYKIIAKDNKRGNQIKAFNMYGTLNMSAAKNQPSLSISRLAMPTRFYDICFKPSSKNTVLSALDKGWQISFRIHNASSLVEPSLKFDVQLDGVLPNLYSTLEAWD